MSSNLPPGVTDASIPGNRAEDAQFDQLAADLSAGLEFCGVSLPDEKFELVLSWLERFQSDSVARGRKIEEDEIRMLSSSAFGVVSGDDGFVDLRTVAQTRTGAMVNHLLVHHKIMCTRQSTDDEVQEMFDHFRGAAQLVEVHVVPC